MEYLKKLIFVCLILNLNFIFAQQKNYSLFFNLGLASDNDALGSFAGGGGGNRSWDSGPILRLGTEYNFYKSIFAQGFLSYSYYKYDGRDPWGKTTNSGYNNMLDLMFAIKAKMSVFYLYLGAGISHQFSDEIRYLEKTNQNISTFIPAKQKTVLAGQFGLGFDVYIYKNFSLLAEGDLFFREYLGSAWLMGVKYTISGK